jgi:uncharacterized protein (TIGR03437 family)
MPPLLRVASCFVIAGLLAIGTGLAQTITTTAGNGSPGFSGDNGSAISAQIDTVYGVAVDGQGNTYVADSRNQRVRKISNGIITTAAGNGQAGYSGDGGAATAAQLSFPRGVAVDTQGNLYIADTGNCRIRKVTSGGIVSTVAGTGTAGFSGDGGSATSAQLSYPEAVAVGPSGNLYVADSWNYRVREIASNGNIQTVAGNGSYGVFGDNGPAAAASLGLIESLTMDTAGNLYLSDAYNHLVRKVAPGGSISTVVGGGFGPAMDGGAATSAKLKFPKGVAVDGQGNLYVADSLNDRIRMVSPAGVISTFAGTGAPGYAGDGGAATAAQLNSPYGLGLETSGVLSFSDMLNYRVRSVAPQETPVITGISNAAGGQTTIAPGAYVSIYGTNLAPKIDSGNASTANQQLPTTLDQVSVTVGGKPADVSYINPAQINIVVPAVTSGTVQVVVTNGQVSSAPFSATVQQDSPAFFLWGEYAIATHLDNSYCGKPGLLPGATFTPAKPGEWIVLWGNGFGSAGAPPGVPTPSDKLYLTAPVTAAVAGANASVYDGAAALAPGWTGLYQVTVQIPSSTPNGDALVQATVGGAQSPSGVLLTVQQ